MLSAMMNEFDNRNNDEKFLDQIMYKKQSIDLLKKITYQIDNSKLVNFISPWKEQPNCGNQNFLEKNNFILFSAKTLTEEEVLKFEVYLTLSSSLLTLNSDTRLDKGPRVPHQ